MKEVTALKAEIDYLKALVVELVTELAEEVGICNVCDNTGFIAVPRRAGEQGTKVRCGACKALHDLIAKARHL